MPTNRKLDRAAVHALRLARRKQFLSPKWGDHVLHNVRAFTTAKKLVVETGRTVMETLIR